MWQTEPFTEEILQQLQAEPRVILYSTESNTLSHGNNELYRSVPDLSDVANYVECASNEEIYVNSSAGSKEDKSFEDTQNKEDVDTIEGELLKMFNNEREQINISKKPQKEISIKVEKPRKKKKKKKRIKSGNESRELLIRLFGSPLDDFEPPKPKKPKIIERRHTLPISISVKQEDLRPLRILKKRRSEPDTSALTKLKNPENFPVTGQTEVVDAQYICISNLVTPPVFTETAVITYTELPKATINQKPVLGSSETVRAEKSVPSFIDLTRDDFDEISTELQEIRVEIITDIKPESAQGVSSEQANVPSLITILSMPLLSPVSPAEPTQTEAVLPQGTSQREHAVIPSVSAQKQSVDRQNQQAKDIQIEVQVGRTYGSSIVEHAQKSKENLTKDTFNKVFSQFVQHKNSEVQQKMQNSDENVSAQAMQKRPSKDPPSQAKPSKLRPSLPPVVRATKQQQQSAPQTAQWQQVHLMLQTAQQNVQVVLQEAQKQPQSKFQGHQQQSVIQTVQHSAVQAAQQRQTSQQQPQFGFQAGNQQKKSVIPTSEQPQPGFQAARQQEQQFTLPLPQQQPQSVLQKTQQQHQPQAMFQTTQHQEPQSTLPNPQRQELQSTLPPPQQKPQFRFQVGNQQKKSVKHQPQSMFQTIQQQEPQSTLPKPQQQELQSTLPPPQQKPQFRFQVGNQQKKSVIQQQQPQLVVQTARQQEQQFTLPVPQQQSQPVFRKAQQQHQPQSMLQTTQHQEQQFTLPVPQQQEQQFTLPVPQQQEQQFTLPVPQQQEQQFTLPKPQQRSQPVFQKAQQQHQPQSTLQTTQQQELQATLPVLQRQTQSRFQVGDQQKKSLGQTIQQAPSVVQTSQQNSVLRTFQQSRAEFQAQCVLQAAQQPSQSIVVLQAAQHQAQSIVQALQAPQQTSATSRTTMSSQWLHAQSAQQQKTSEPPAYPQQGLRNPNQQVNSNYPQLLRLWREPAREASRCQIISNEACAEKMYPHVHKITVWRVNVLKFYDGTKIFFTESELRNNVVSLRQYTSMSTRFFGMKLLKDLSNVDDVENFSMGKILSAIATKMVLNNVLVNVYRACTSLDLLLRECQNECNTPFLRKLFNNVKGCRDEIEERTSALAPKFTFLQLKQLETQIQQEALIRNWLWNKGVTAFDQGSHEVTRSVSTIASSTVQQNTLPLQANLSAQTSTQVVQNEFRSRNVEHQSFSRSSSCVDTVPTSQREESRRHSLDNNSVQSLNKQRFVPRILLPSLRSQARNQNESSTIQDSNNENISAIHRSNNVGPETAERRTSEAEASNAQIAQRSSEERCNNEKRVLAESVQETVETDEVSSTMKNETKDIVDDVIDLTWIDDGDEKEMAAEVIEFKAFPFKVEDGAVENESQPAGREVVSPADSGLGSPVAQSDNDGFKCLCGNRATFVCECKSSMYCGNDCQIRDWIYHQKLCHKMKS